VSLAAGGDLGIQYRLLAGLEVGGAAVASIRCEHSRHLAGVGLNPLQHWNQMHCVSGLVADAHGHDT
jgi:hypothetical protein